MHDQWAQVKTRIMQTYGERSN